MAKPSDIVPVSKITPWVRMMVVAGSGWGKTVFAGTAPRCLILSFDPEGTESAAVAGSEAEVWPRMTWEKCEEAFRYLRDGGGCDDYDWLVIDTLNEMQKRHQDYILALPTRSAKNDPEILAQQDYQRNQLAMVRIVKQFNDLPINILWNVQWKKEDDETDLGFRYEPMIHGQQGDLAEQIKGYMKTVSYGHWVNIAGPEGNPVQTRRLTTAQMPPFMGRDRSGRFPAQMDNPTIPKLLAAGGPGGARKVAPPRKAPPKKRATPTARR